jgi:hypothetical protein
MLYQQPKIESSFRENDLGRVLYELVMTLRPVKIVEFGVLHGYSTVSMAMALHELGRGYIEAYDLWDEYEFNHGNKEEVKKTIEEYGLSRHVLLLEGDAFYTEIRSADLIFVDLSNDGDKIEKIYNLYHLKAPIAFEGGTKERDEVDWMKKYNRCPIQESLVPYHILDSRFPSLSFIP